MTDRPLFQPDDSIHRHRERFATGTVTLIILLLVWYIFYFIVRDPKIVITIVVFVGSGILSVMVLYLVLGDS